MRSPCARPRMVASVTSRCLARAAIELGRVRELFDTPPPEGFKKKTEWERESSMGIDKIDEAWDREVDVIALGAGPAGMAAAIVSKNEGQEPLILEKTDQVGGTGAWSV